MSKLDKKLYEALESVGESYYPEHEYPESYKQQNVKTIAEAIPKIKQAFIDDGWRKLPSEADIQPLIDEGLASYLMTGQEWYDNLKKTIVQEAKGQSEPDTFASGLSYALKVAKKAAGIESVK